MISVKKSLPGLDKNLKWLPEMAFQGLISGLPPRTQISSYGHALIGPIG